MLRYKYAYNSEGKVVNIYDVPKEGHLSLKFTCIECGNQMVACIGSMRRYFRHKVSCDELACSSESYLHKLGKLKLKDLYDNNRVPFEIALKGKTICKEKCTFYSKYYSKCKGEYTYHVDLHKDYDICEVEKEYNGYRADLLLSSSKFSDKDCISLEINVHHKCSENKVCSGIKIIEIRIKDEDDITNIVNNGLYESGVEVKCYNFQSNEMVREMKKPENCMKDDAIMIKQNAISKQRRRRYR